MIDDDPRYTVRSEELNVEHAALAGKIKRPIVVLDSHMRMPDGAQLLTNENLLVATTEESTGAAINTVTLPADESGRVELNALLAHLADMDYNEMLFECGQTLAGELLARQLVDELVIYVAPMVLGDTARSLVGLGTLTSLNEAYRFQFKDVRSLGKDIRVTAVPAAPAN